MGIARLLSNYSRLRATVYNESQFDTWCMLADLADAWRGVLTERQRLVLHRLFIEGYTREELSQESDLTVSQIASASIRGLKKLYYELNGIEPSADDL